MDRANVSAVKAVVHAPCAETGDAARSREATREFEKRNGIQIITVSP